MFLRLSVIALVTVVVSCATGPVSQITTGPNTVGEIREVRFK